MYICIYIYIYVRIGGPSFSSGPTLFLAPGRTPGRGGSGPGGTRAGTRAGWDSGRVGPGP